MYVQIIFERTGVFIYTNSEDNEESDVLVGGKLFVTELVRLFTFLQVVATDFFDQAFILFQCFQDTKRFVEWMPYATNDRTIQDHEDTYDLDGDSNAVINSQKVERYYFQGFRIELRAYSDQI